MKTIYHIPNLLEYSSSYGTLLIDKEYVDTIME